MLKMNEYIHEYTMRDYSNFPQGEIKLDCSLGVNSESLPALVFTRLGQLNAANQNDIKYYPHTDAVHQTIAGYYKKKGIGWITKDNILLGCGSLDLLGNINLLCLTRGKKVLGHGPQFTAYIDQVNCIGSMYCHCDFKKENNYLFVAGDYAAEMNSDYDLFIVENPNNPTGQTIRLDDLKIIAEKAKRLNTILIVDEAYGDYMEFTASAINLLYDYPNVVVTRTFSKAFGAAGMRMGYALFSPNLSSRPEDNILTQLKKLENTFSCNGVARVIAQALLDTTEDIIKIDKIMEHKQEIIKSLSVFKLAATSVRVPIMTIYYETGDRNFDLQLSLLENEKLLTVSCGSYFGLDKRAVRIMLPSSDDRVADLKQMLISAQNRLK
ncbi:MAG: aminotransferase class I/II-fold pyridoxal phosphate-dependent enzyme [Treponema sp.]|nr:aminotransferase class I/II-fold pyridoxal phosphate-dependent enzyme [Treponema sp.]